MLPLLRQGRGLSALVSPYTLDWRPLSAPGTRTEALHAAGRDFARRMRPSPAIRLDMLDPAMPGLEALLSGLAEGGLRPLRFRHAGNWHEMLPPGSGWEAWLTARPPALRNTIRRKMARASREATHEVIAAPGPGLEAGVTAFEDVRARSWKPYEPFPGFDGALMRAAAREGVLRLGILRMRSGGEALAAQYWILDKAGCRARVLKLHHAKEQRAASPGTVLTALMIRSLLEEDGVQELDFGRGDDAYKREWVVSRRQRIGVILADPLHPAGLAALFRRGIGRLLAPA